MKRKCALIHSLYALTDVHHGSRIPVRISYQVAIPYSRIEVSKVAFDRTRLLFSSRMTWIRSHDDDTPQGQKACRLPKRLHGGVNLGNNRAVRAETRIPPEIVHDGCDTVRMQLQERQICMGSTVRCQRGHATTGSGDFGIVPQFRFRHGRLLNVDRMDAPFRPQKLP